MTVRDVLYGLALRRGYLNLDFARALVTELGGDSELIQDGWCVTELAAAYPELVRPAKDWLGALACEDQDADVRRLAVVAWDWL